MKYYAVIDTNVLVSAIISLQKQTPPTSIISYIKSGIIVPLYNDEIYTEYLGVLQRPKFHFSPENINGLLSLILSKGILSPRLPSSEEFPDEKDIVFYEVALSKDNSYLVTGNLKHFPKTPIVVTPAEMVAIINQDITNS